jgi:hypothetical protein
MAGVKGQEGKALSDNDIERGLHMLSAGNTKDFRAVLKNFAKRSYWQMYDRHTFLGKGLMGGAEFPLAPQDFGLAPLEMGTHGGQPEERRGDQGLEDPLNIR